MKIAIIGAGLAGLACAHELEKHGLKPTLYEMNHFIGEAYPHVGAALEIAARPVGDPVKYMKSKLGLDIKPINTVNRIIHHSPNKTTEIKGNLGYFLNRSKEPDDIKIQIYSKLKNPHILFNTYGDYEPLARQFDYVVAANGYINFTNELGCWYEWVNTYVRGAVVLGDFDPNTLILWLNKDYCKNGYAYLTPFNNKKASLILVTTEVNEKEIDFFWELFLYTEKIKYTILEEFKLNHRSGYVYPHRVGNIFLAGNAGGVIDPFLGFGVLGSIVTGVMAARSIVKGKDYEKLIRGTVIRNVHLHEFRKALDTTSNKGYDILISTIGLPGLSQLIYQTPLNVIKYGSYAIKIISKMK